MVEHSQKNVPSRRRKYMLYVGNDYMLHDWNDDMLHDGNDDYYYVIYDRNNHITCSQIMGHFRVMKDVLWGHCCNSKLNRNMYLKAILIFNQCPKVLIISNF